MACLGALGGAVVVVVVVDRRELKSGQDNSD